MSFRKILLNTTGADRILFLLLLSVSLSGIFFIKDIMPQSRSVLVEVNGKPVYILPLDKNRILSVEGPAGNTTIEIKDHAVRITDSPCSNKLCIKQGWIHSGSIVCLPNRVVVTVGDKDRQKDGPDAITG
ncbi:MAG: NusG domain II-containing protein [Thermodesulfovibrionales bacterium]